jgi:hypothetical protein
MEKSQEMFNPLTKFFLSRLNEDEEGRKNEGKK